MVIVDILMDGMRLSCCCKCCWKDADDHDDDGDSNDHNIYDYDDVIKWKHFPRSWPIVRGIYRSPPVDSTYKGQWRGALMFTLICAWTSGWANNKDAGDLRRHHADYDVTVMDDHNSYDNDYVTGGISKLEYFVFRNVNIEPLQKTPCIISTYVLQRRKVSTASIIKSMVGIFNCRRGVVRLPIRCQCGPTERTPSHAMLSRWSSSH